ncbi:uncharacterized protein LOC141805465 [Halichoeres trimaculatus]|uniref:uncharacterized protein LOC141805465 n=1 Tax=Halichoeres trimaculatus TaxID=147232 RepID=UPI003D9E7A2B
MVDACCAPGCKNNRGDGKGRAFYRIPKDPERRQKWVAAIKRARRQQKKSEDWEPKNPGFRVCSEHFISGQKSDNPLSLDYVPSVFPYVPSKDKRKKQQKINRRRTKQAEKSSPPPAEDLSVDWPEDDSYPLAGSDIVAGVSPVKTSHSEPQSTPDNHESTATPPCASEDRETNIRSFDSINEKSLQNNDKKVKILTGLPTFSVLMILFDFVAPFLKDDSGMTPFQQFMLTLIKLRLNFTFDFLSYYFSVDLITVSKLFKHCISVMHCRLVPILVIWPDRESFKKTLPCVFRNTPYEKTVCIIDCFEIFIEKPINLSALHPVHESLHTIKYLIAICPQGMISFVSNGWGGCTSDKFITEQSNFLCNLLPEDLVLAYQSFTFNKNAQSSQPETKISAFTPGKEQLEPVRLKGTRSLPSLKKHIKKVIGLLRLKYTILQGSVPIDFMFIDKENDVTCLDKIVNVCCALTNVCESVVSF